MRLASTELKKRGVEHPMANMAIDMASKKANDQIDKHLKGGRRMRVNGVGTTGIRMSCSPPKKSDFFELLQFLLDR